MRTLKKVDRPSMKGGRVEFLDTGIENSDAEQGNFGSRRA